MLYNRYKLYFFWRTARLAWEGNSINTYEKWRYYTHDKATLDSCEPQIARHNISSLLLLTKFVMVVILLFSIFPLFFEQKPYKFVFYFIAFALEFCIYLYARALNKRKNVSALTVFGGFLCFFIVLMSFGLYIGVLEASTSYAINFMIFLICGQIMFVLNPLRSLLLNVGTVITFVASVMLVKAPSLWPTDIANVLAAAICGTECARHRTGVLVREMLSSQQMERERNQYKADSETDALTGLSNRREFFRSASHYLDLWQKTQETVCMIMLDLDYFKGYNDYYGHPMGDEALRAVGNVLRQAGEDTGYFVSRVGGEEFAVLFAEDCLAEAESFAQQLHRRIYDLHIEHIPSSIDDCITASLGMYICHGDTHMSVHALYENADQALYEAKRRGRNCIVRVDSQNDEYEVLA